MTPAQPERKLPEGVPPDPTGSEVRGPLSRRSFLRAATGLAGAGALTGCAGPGVLSGLAAGRRPDGSIDFWNLFGGGDGVRLQEMLAEFRATHPEIGLTAVTLAWGNPYYTKLSLATLGGKPPDVAVAHLTRARTLVQAGLLEELTPQALESVGITPDQLSARPWEAGLVDGRAYAVPIDTHPFVTFYNTEICEQAGLLEPDGTLVPMDSPEAFTAALAAAKEVTGSYGGVVAFVNETATPWRMFQSLYSQLGGEVLEDGGTSVVLDDATATQVLEFMGSLTSSGLCPASADYQGSIAQFANGDAAFLFQGEWEIATFQTAQMPFSMTLFPNVFGGPDGYAVQADSHTLVIPKQPRRDDEQLRRSLTFIRSMLDQSATWAQGGHVPAWLPYRDGPEFAALEPQRNYAAAADAAVYDPDGWYSGSGSNFEIVLGSSIGAVLAGQLEPAAAVRQMRSKLTTLANTASPIDPGV